MDEAKQSKLLPRVTRGRNYGDADNNKPPAKRDSSYYYYGDCAGSDSNTEDDCSVSSKKQKLEQHQEQEHEENNDDGKKWLDMNNVKLPKLISDYPTTIDSNVASVQEKDEVTRSNGSKETSERPIYTGNTLYKKKFIGANVPGVCAGCLGNASVRQRNKEIYNKRYSTVESDDNIINNATTTITTTTTISTTNNDNQNPAHPESDDSETIILLCDGDGCNNESHIECCVPQVKCIPCGDWLCQDCNPTGSTKELIRYLESHDEERVNYYTNRAEKLKERNKNVEAAHLYRHIYVQALEDIELLDSFAEFLLQRDVAMQYMQHQSKDDELLNLRLPISELENAQLISNSFARLPITSLSQSTDPDFFVGKPVKLYVPVQDVYHTGRIVDCRKRTLDSQYEYLVRFAAGYDDRKKSYLHWMILEEHCLIVGTQIVWVKCTQPHLVPGIIYLQSARELVPALAKYDESIGQITYRDKPELLLSTVAVRLGTDSSNSIATKNNNTDTQSPQNDKSFAPPRSYPYVWALVKLFGSDKFQYKSLYNTESASLSSDNVPAASATAVYKACAMAELNCQVETRQWRQMPQQHSDAFHALSSRDVYTLGPLLPTNAPVEPVYHAELCPLVYRGLDRQYIAQMMHSVSGLPLTKDLAASLQCTDVPVDFSKFQ